MTFLLTNNFLVDSETWKMILVNGVGETLYMTLASSLIAYVIGVPLGIVLVVADKGGISPYPKLQMVIGTIVNLVRSVPFLLLIVLAMPITRFFVGTTLGSTAMVIPLAIAAAPYIGRVVESSLREVDAGVIEAAKSMGASNWQIIWKVILPEAKPSLLIGAGLAVTTILGYSAMAGIIGAGGLGAYAINYGYYRGNQEMLWINVVVIVIIFQILQEVFMKLAKVSDKRSRS